MAESLLAGLPICHKTSTLFLSENAVYCLMKKKDLADFKENISKFSIVALQDNYVLVSNHPMKNNSSSLPSSIIICYNLMKLCGFNWIS